MKLRHRLKQAMFAFSYNTTSLVNMMMTIGVLAPYVIIGAVLGEITGFEVLEATAITLLATYCYLLVYVVNDYLDRKKDAADGSRKVTANHLFGKWSLVIVLSVFAAIIAGTEILWPRLQIYTPLYCIGLVVLSYIHSVSKRTKLLTVFLERLAKFIVPLVFIQHGIGGHVLEPVIVAALVMFPFSFMFDYTFLGYLRDRLKLDPRWRYAMYGVYYVLLGFGLAITNEFAVISYGLTIVIAYICIYLGLNAVSDLLAYLLPLGRIDRRYEPVVAHEKRRLIAYALVQAVAIIVGGLYVGLN